MIFNSAIFILIVKNHTPCCLQEKSIKLRENADSATHKLYQKRQLAIFLACAANMGLTWIFATFVGITTNVYAKTAFALLFCIHVSYTIYALIIKLTGNHYYSTILE